MARSVLKRDQYKKARGGWSRILVVSCAACGNDICHYQKDGRGSLKRMYLDRILAPLTMRGLQKFDIKEVPALRCKTCDELLGTPYVYKKEKRKAYRMYQDAVIKKVVNTNKAQRGFQSSLGL